jgi:hypothetical protein
MQIERRPRIKNPLGDGSTVAADEENYISRCAYKASVEAA